MRKDDRIRLRHMLDAAVQAQVFVRGRDREALDHDQMLVWALVKAMEIIGEAACQVSAETRIQTPQIPWSKIIGMRHRLVHAYFDINLDILLKTVQEALPPLISDLESIVNRAEDDEV
ncbi:MAG: DUF86 domain-containing protein [Thermoflexales bacterium]|nr:DUF86 domain-containing protein [Thermoflexales bacterium]